RSTTFLAADFLAPALASLVFVDAPSSFLPDFGQLVALSQGRLESGCASLIAAQPSNGVSKMQAEAKR
ncbi:hypothetical protein ACC734_40060, partial [Rhizobium ruizarguesonis]